ncbi:MAG: DUF167 domain-containing protein [Myxococcales bacterium]|nr:DUF167 domain-containing protein [Myxococcales bacterium]
MSATIIRAGAGESVEIDVQVVPRASRSRVVGVHGDRLKLQLAAPPVDGAANEALIEVIADLLACPRGAVSIARGHTGKRKTLRVVGVDVDAVRRALGLAGGGPAAAPSRDRERRRPPLAASARGLALVAALAPALACESAGSLPSTSSCRRATTTSTGRTTPPSSSIPGRPRASRSTASTSASPSNSRSTRSSGSPPSTSPAATSSSPTAAPPPSPSPRAPPTSRSSSAGPARSRPSPGR